MFLREYLPMFYRWCAACGERPVFTDSTVLCRGCKADLDLELEGLCRNS